MTIPQKNPLVKLELGPPKQTVQLWLTEEIPERRESNRSAFNLFIIDIQRREAVEV